MLVVVKYTVAHKYYGTNKNATARSKRPGHEQNGHGTNKNATARSKRPRTARTKRPRHGRKCYDTI